MIAFLQNAILFVVPLFVVITAIVTVHELGHFAAGRAFGVAIERFSIGFGRALLSWKDRSGVEWRIAWAPLGGYVRFALDENVASVPDGQDLKEMQARIVAIEGPGAERKYLPFKPLWQRAIISVAGPAANFFLAVALFSLLLATLGHYDSPYKVGEIMPGSAAAHAGLLPGDRILAANGRRLPGAYDLKQYLAYRYGEPMDITVQRNGQILHLKATPEPVRGPSGFGWNETEGVLGFVIARDGAWGFRRLDPISAVAGGFGETWDVFTTTGTQLGRLVTGRTGLDQLHGVVGMARVSGAITKRAIADAPNNAGEQALGVILSLVSFTALISVGIGIMNLLPLPILDGGHLVFYAYEWLAKRPLGARVQAASYRVGLALLVGLMLFANLHDLPLTRVFHFFGSLFS
ncbi:MAG TPA: M50 family metallopeptidase [Caulobacteraceae bacterium]